MNGYVRCWHCNGNGATSVPVKGQHCWQSQKCIHCNGSGIDSVKTEALRNCASEERFVFKEITIEDLEDAGILRSYD